MTSTVENIDWFSSDHGWGIRNLPRKRKAQLGKLLVKSRVLSLNTLSPFVNQPLTGADVFWLAARTLVSTSRTHQEAEDELSFVIGRHLILKSLNISGASLFAVQLNDAILAHAQLQEVFLRLGQLKRACLIGTNLRQADLGAANLNSADLSKAILNHANLSQADLENAILRDALLEDSNLQDASLEGATLRGAILQRSDLRRVNLKRAELDNAHLEHCDLSYAHLDNSSLNRAVLENTNLYRVSLIEADLLWTKMNKAFLFEASLQRSNLRNANLSATILTGADLSEANLSEANLSEAVLAQSRLINAYLLNANLEKAHLEGAHLEGANLIGANLEGADLRGVSMNIMTILPKELTPARMRVAGVYWGGTKLSEINWKASKHLGDEQWAKKHHPWRTRGLAYQTAARAYAALSKALRDQGLNSEASDYTYCEQRLRHRALGHEILIIFTLGGPRHPIWGKVTEGSQRKRKPFKQLWKLPHSLGYWIFLLGRSIVHWFFLFLLWIIVGYGEKPGRTLFAYLGVVVAFTLLYHLLAHLGNNFQSWLEAAIISITSFHGRGFLPSTESPIRGADDVSLAAAFEAIIGLFIELVFVATFGKRFLGS